MSVMESASDDPVRIERLTFRLRDDFLRFFDGLRSDAGCDAANCYCHYFHVATAIPWDTLNGAANRTAMSARIDAGEMDGFLAYDDDRVVGWLNAQPYHKLSHLWSRLVITTLECDVPAHEAAAIVCFVTDSPCQQHNIYRALLDGALISLRDRGIRIVDAFPRAFDEGSAAAHPDRGTLPLFLAAGFSIQRQEHGPTIVRKIL